MIEWTKDKNGALVSVDAQTKKPVGIPHLPDGLDGLTIDPIVEAFSILKEDDSRFLSQAPKLIADADCSR